MAVKNLPLGISYTDERTCRSRPIDLPNNCRPNQPVRRVGRSRRFSAYAHHSANRARYRALMSAKEDHRWRPVARKASTRRVNDVSEVNGRKKLFNQPLAKLPF